MTNINPAVLYDRPRLVANWLLFCALMIFCMAIIGAITRLTESGLSITEWKPITGAVPPTTAQDWDHAFKLYQATPEYRAKNIGMTLTEFKKIYFWEWIHRFWGRLIGLVFMIPFLFFWLMRWTPAKLNWPLFGVFILGGAQGFVGWFMVQSGLVHRPDVSHYRLALHLFLALTLYAALLWLSLSVRPLSRASFAIGVKPAGPCLKVHGIIALLMVAITIVWGAFVAGLDAGLIYNEFPTMGHGQLMPREMWHMAPTWMNLFENHASVQFTHRWLAVTTVIIVLAFCIHAMLADVQGRVFPALAVMVLLQAGMGILTLLSGINIYAAVVHQAGAIILLGLMVTALHGLFRKRPAMMF